MITCSLGAPGVWRGGMRFPRGAATARSKDGVGVVGPPLRYLLE